MERASRRFLIARILEGFDLADKALGEADRIHLLAEATKAAYRQRDALVADPAFQPFDVEELLSEASVGAMRARISTGAPADPAAFDMPAPSRHGLCCSRRPRWQMLYPSSIPCSSPSAAASMPPRSGVLLQNRGSGFRLIEGHPNAIAPRKRAVTHDHSRHAGEERQARDGTRRDGRPVSGHGTYPDPERRPRPGPRYPAGVGRTARSFAFDGALALEPTITRAVADDLTARDIA